MAESTRKPISFEEIERFLNGRNSIKRAISVEIGYGDTQAKIIYRTEKDEKAIKYDGFYPFVWAKYSVCDKMCGGDRRQVKQLLDKYGITVEALRTKADDGTEEERMVNGYKFIFKALQPMSYSKFLKFFKDAGTPVFSDKNNDDDPEAETFLTDDRPFLTVSPQEQYMIATGTRLFQGYETYDDIHRLLWDIESEGLVAERHRITKIGIRINKGFEKILTIAGETEEEKDASEKKAIEDFLRIIYTYDPDTIAGHNSENFDWNFIMKRYELLGGDFMAFTEELFGKPVYKSQKPTTLKLGGEVETFYQTIVPDHIVLDSLHAVRRAQAGDSSMLKADLKYATKYLSLNKPNRVYIPGDKITPTLKTTGAEFAFNDENGDWYKIDEKHLLKEGYELKTGPYIVDRYLLDDIWETDKVELQLNEANFLINKIVPTGFNRACTMGTAGIWKLIILAWSYEQRLAVPAFGKGGAFTGGLSRLCRTGFVKRVIKLDYNSLYPAILLTWHIDPKIDIQHVLPAMLNYVLTQREKFKGLKKTGGKNAEKLRKEYKESGDKKLLPEIQHWENEEMKNDRLQNPLKILGNSAFGSFGAENLFPLGSKDCAERITCTGRQALRLMISHFMELGYEPIVGDTDGFNFRLPDESQFRYTKEHPYIGKGLSRETKEGVEYVGYKADVAEFNDIYMRDFHYHPEAVNKMGLGIDELPESTINFSRKNYADYFPENPYPKDVKLVGNTIKSKKMPGYISEFLDKGVRMLLKDDGPGFLDYYYSYIEKIYNYQIPLVQIASRGKIKKSMDEYIRDCSTLTKAGRPKSRQAWYELCIKAGLKPDIGETIYYINTGSKKSESDIKKVTKWYEILADGTKADKTKEVEKGAKEWKKNHENYPNGVYPEIEWQKENNLHYVKEYELVFASELLDRNIIDSEDDHFCDDIGKEYNVAKYIDMFNKRITPLLVCFSKEIRNSILIENPKDRKYFTKAEATLISGEPNNPGDEDKIEDILRMEDREIEFWINHPEWEPPYTKECKVDWEGLKQNYLNKKEAEKRLGIDLVRVKWSELIEALKHIEDEQREKILSGNLTPEMKEIVELDPLTNNFVSKQFKGVVIGTVYDLIPADETTASFADD